MKTIVITWGTAWLWKDIVESLSDDQYKVFVLVKNKTKWEELFADKKHIHIVACDITKPNEITDAVTYIQDTTNHIDTLINNAGIRTDDEIDTVDRQDNVFQTNALGNMRCTEEFLSIFKQQWKGHMINILSSAALDNHPHGNNKNWKFYGASKWAFNWYLQALREDLIDTSLRISNIYPWWFESDLYESAGKKNAHKQPRMMDTHEVTKAVLFAMQAPEDICVDKIVITKNSKDF